MHVYDNTFVEGYKVHLCLFDDRLGYIIIYDIHTGIGEMQYFTDLQVAMNFIKEFKKY